MRAPRRVSLGRFGSLVLPARTDVDPLPPTAVSSSGLTVTPLAAVAALLSIVLPGDPAALRLFPRLLEEGEVPGLSIVGIRDSKVAWQRAYAAAGGRPRAIVSYQRSLELSPDNASSD